MSILHIEIYLTIIPYLVKLYVTYIQCTYKELTGVCYRI